MRSGLPKPLHAVAGRSMLAHVLAATHEMGADAVAMVVGPNGQAVAEAAARVLPDVVVRVQMERLGTAHAVLAARDAIGRGYDDIVVLYADVPLVRPATLRRLRRGLAEGSAVSVLGFRAANPAGYGRLIAAGDNLVAIREHKDASEAERTIELCNSGLMAIDGTAALDLLDRIGCDNAPGEYYLTDAVEAAIGQGRGCSFMVGEEAEVMGVNDRVQLAAAEAAMQRRLREAAMRGGATLVAPETVFLCHDTVLGQDVTVEPHCVFGPGVTVADGAVIHAFSHLEGASVAVGASVGPYGRLRPGAAIGENAKVGNFVEVKNATVGRGAKISHLSYVGDAEVGADANLGAGTITCNYDGFNKARTVIGPGAFVGSNTALVAPVTVGAGAYVGSGSVVTADVEPDALALGRGRQVNKPGWAAAFRAAQRGRKAPKQPR